MKFIVGCGVIALLSSSTGAAAQMACEGLTPQSLGMAGVRFTEVAKVPAGEDSPAAQCRIRAVTAERTGMDGKDYALRFELALPDAWNGDFVHQFNGGNDGEIDPATGALSREAGTGKVSPLARGYAVVSSDAGHDGKANPDAGLAGGARFGFDFEARQMYGYKAVAILDPIARDMVQAFYGADIEHAYGVGCSNGGRHAMVAAARMTDSFDGLLIGAPGYKLPINAIQNALSQQIIKRVSGDLATSFSREDLNVFADGIRAACDSLDGLEDGLVMDTKACQAAFDPKALQCSDGQNSACLSEAQITALIDVHRGADKDEAPIYNEFLWDTGIASGSWRFWKIESPVKPWNNKPIIGVMGASSVAQIFTTPPTAVDGNPDALEEFQQTFDARANVASAFATTPEFPESAMEVMAPPGYDDPKLEAFRDAGGKMMIFHGVSDPVFSAKDTGEWFARLDANNDGDAKAFAKYYPVPGMGHCSTGPTTDSFDMFGALVDWVENGKAPDAVVASARDGNKELPEALKGASRPLCSFPLMARHVGGDTASADSFACE